MTRVEQGALELIGIGLGNPEVVVRAHFQMNALIEAALQQLAHRQHQRVHLHGFWVEDCRRENANKRWVRPAARLAEVTPRSIRLSRSSVRPRARRRRSSSKATDDAGEHIVEVVSNAASKLADRFHFLRLAQRFFVVAKLCGALFNLLLEGFQSRLQASFAFTQVDQPIACFILSSPPRRAAETRLTSVAGWKGAREKSRCRAGC